MSTFSVNQSNDTSSSMLIRSCMLLAPQETTGLLSEQDIFIVGQHIQSIGPSGTLVLPEEKHYRVIEGYNKLALPGLINAHTHSPENVLKATSPSLPLELWNIALYGNFLHWTPRLTYASALLGAVEMLKTGTTALLDHLWSIDGLSQEHMTAALQAYEDVGIRATVAPFIEDRDMIIEFGEQHGFTFPPHPFTQRFEQWAPLGEQLAILEDLIATWHLRANGRIRCIVGPSGIQWCSRELLHICRNMAERYDSGLHIHAIETRLQARVVQKMLGEGGIAFLEHEGILRPGTSLAHCIWMEPGDLERLARSGATVVHNPISNMRLGSGIFPLREALHKGVHVALGSDGSASNDTQNMFSVLKLTGLLHNHTTIDYHDWPQASSILNLATRGGASALGLSSELGLIAPGQLADIVLLDTQTAAFFPLRDPALHLIYCEDGTSVDTVIVNGQIVVERGIIRTIDELALRQELRDLCSAQWTGISAYLDSTPHTHELLEIFDKLRTSFDVSPRIPAIK
jgi:5-methylthioadenosine/S-adenosylhomocysteine deaminase